MNPRLKYFLAVAQERHFGRAAERLHMTQPPLSQQVQLLERDLGIQLFKRTTRRVELTDAGQVLYEGAQRALHQLDEAILDAQRVHRGEAGSLRVAFVSTAAIQLVPDVMQAFRQRHPNANLQLFHMTSAQQEEAFRSGSIDVGFLRGPVPQDIEVELLAKEPLMVVLPDAHPLARRKRVSMRALIHEPFVIWDRRESASMAQSVLDLCARAGYHPNIALEVTNPPALLSLVAGGIGVSIVPESALRLRSSGLTFRRLDDRSAYCPMFLAWRSKNAPAVLPRFVTLVRELCRRGES